jgi:nucleoside-diphosphate-sugar epimerase
LGRNLVTGGLGLVGRQLADLLLEKGEQVVILDTASPARLAPRVRDRVEIVRADLTDWIQVLDAVKQAKVDTIYHVAAILPPGTEQNPALAYGVNLTGTHNILEAARLLDVGQVVFSSTTAVWGSELPDPIPNDYVQRPITMYGTTKVCCERLGEYYWRRFGLDFRSVRFICIMGPGRVPGVGWTAYTSLVIEETARGNPFTLKVRNDLRLHFLYLKDAAYALYDLKNGERSRLTHCVYNVDGFPATTDDIVQAILRHNADARIEYAFDPEYQHVMDTQYALLTRRTDDTLARADWGWEPHYSLDAAIADFIDDVREGRLLQT